MSNLYATAKSTSRVRKAAGNDIGLQATTDGALYIASYGQGLALEGRAFNAPHTTAQNTAVTGQTSFVNTTPTFLLRVPNGTTALPMLFKAGPSGTVAGGVISVIYEIDAIERYASGGTAETIQNVRTDAPVAAACTVFSNPTAVAGFGTRVGYDLLQATVAATTITPTIFQPDPYPILVGPAAFLVYTFAGTTGPTWQWTLKWAELPTATL